MAALYLACFDEPKKLTDLHGEAGIDASLAEVEAALEAFCSHGLMMRDGNLFWPLPSPRRRRVDVNALTLDATPVVIGRRPFALAGDVASLDEGERAR